MTEQAPPEFYSDRYYRAQCGGHELFESFDGWQLEPIRRKAIAVADPRAGQHVLDIGCGRGEMVLACALRGANAIGLDFSSDAIGIARTLLDRFDCHERVDFIYMDASNLGFRANRFDTIFMLDFVEHVAQDRLKDIMRQCYCILKPGGRLIAHTGPTREFVQYGQHIKRLLYTVTRRPVPAAVTMESEARLAGHCNLHTRGSLWEALEVFEEKSVEYHFSIEQGWVKHVAQALGLRRYLAFNLWGIAGKSGS